MKNTLSRVSFIVHENKKFEVSDRLLCTISGGQDSILILILLYNLQALYLFRIHLTYCNHFWQPTNFYTLFELLKVSYLIDKPITNFVPKLRVLSEEDAHFWRQNNFAQIGIYFNLNNIILGHSLSDKIETSFWHFIRGSGPNGLTSLTENSFIATKNFKKVLAQVSAKPKSYKNISEIKFLDTTNKQKKYFLHLNLQLRDQNVTCPTQHVFKCSKYKLIRGIGASRNLQSSIGCSTQNKNLNLQKTQPRNIFPKNKLLQQSIYIDLLLARSQIKVRRPLLDFSRTAISQLIKKTQLPRIIDNTNQSKKLIRNKLRLLILPLLNSSLQLKFQRNINKYVNIVADEQTYFSIVENKLLKIYLNNPLVLKSLSKVPIAMKRYIVKTLLTNYISNQISLNYITNIITFTE